MKTTSLFTSATLVAALLLSSAAPVLARHDRGCGPRPCYDSRYDYRYHRGKHHRVRGGDVAAGIIGGVVGLVVLDRLINDRPPAYRSYVPPPPPPAYGSGYRDGYLEGYERARREQYDYGRTRGYYDGYRAGNY